jgi:hypothetical protein
MQSSKETEKAILEKLDIETNAVRMTLREDSENYIKM